MLPILSDRKLFGTRDENKNGSLNTMHTNSIENLKKLEEE